MPALKLFVSHSSRLDDVEHKYTRDDHNWRLLDDTCRAIRHRYGHRIEVLVDKDGLLPGDDWSHRLNLWLAECHVAIILFSKRAIDKSDWVAKEAAILSWRAELDAKFKLIPVMLEGQSDPADLAREFSGVLKIDQYQCIPNARTADDILAGIVRKLGEPEDLAGEYPQTPLESLQGGIAKLLSEGATTASLQEALQAVGCAAAPDGVADRQRYADLLARQFLRTRPAVASACSSACFRIFQEGLSALKPAPTKERARELFQYIRPLWVEPADAGSLRCAQGRKMPLALNGRLIGWSDDELKTRCYTLERFIERAWPGTGSDKFLPVPLPEARSLSEVQQEIRRRFFGASDLPPGPNPDDFLDRAVNRDVRTIVLVILAAADKGGLPDPAFLSDLARLFEIYDKLMLVFDIGADRPVLPGSVKDAQPRLEDPDALLAFLTCEYDAFCDERATKTYLDQKYGTGP